MKRSTGSLLTLGLVAGLCGGIVAVQAQNQSASPQAHPNMSFFITSVGKGDGANLGGLEGADAHCAALAKAAGSAKTTWRAYLSTTNQGQTPGVDARERIGSGPWYNSKGELIANNVDHLHDLKNENLTKAKLLDEKGNVVNGRGDTPNEHDILTGSDSAGRYIQVGGNADTTCRNWTSNAEGSAILGHHDRQGPNNNRNFVSWNAAHGSTGCSQANLVQTGGAGKFYCFAAN